MREGESSTKAYVFDGTKIIEVYGSVPILIKDEDHLNALKSKVGPGAVAYKTGWKKAWQLDPDGENWVPFIGA